MSPQTNRNVLLGMLGGVVLGAVAGFVIPQVMLMLGIIGRLFVNALQILLLPLIPALIIIGVSALGHASKITRATASTVIYFLGTTLAAVVIGTILVLIFQPGGAAATNGAFVPDMVNRARATSFPDVFSAFIPDNLFAALNSGQYLGLVVLSLVFAGVLAVMGSRGRVVVDFFKVIAEVSLQIVTLLLYAAPVGLFALVGSTIARNPAAIEEVGGNLLWLTITFLLAALLHGLVVLPALLHFFAKRNPITYLRATAPALTTAFGTASSAAAFPFTYRNVVEDSGVDSRAGSLVLPLGASMNANGTALYLVIAAIFTAQLFNIPLDIFQVVALAILAVILSLGTTAVPGGALFSLSILFATLEFPFEAYGVIGLLVVVDWLFDRARTALNVWGDIVGAAIIGESFEFKTARATRGVTEPERPPSRRERPPSRRERPPRERQTREREPREHQTGDAAPARRPAREPRETDRRGRGRERKPERTPRPERAPKKEAEPRSSAPPKPESRLVVPPPAEPSRPPQRQPERPEPQRPPRREPERPAPPAPQEQRPRPPAVPGGSESVTEERGRLAVNIAAQMRDIDRRPPPEPPPTEEKPVQREAPEKPPAPEIRRRPLPAELRPERRPEEPEEGAPPPPVDATEPEPSRRLEPPPPPKPEPVENRPPQVRPPEPPAPVPPSAREPVRESEPETTSEPQPPQEDPRLRDILSSLAASRERTEAESEISEERIEREEKLEDAAENERQVSYGRSRVRRGQHPGEKPPAPEPEQPEPGERKDGFDVDSVNTFGRSRKKRRR